MEQDPDLTEHRDGPSVGEALRGAHLLVSLICSGAQAELEAATARVCERARVWPMHCTGTWPRVAGVGLPATVTYLPVTAAPSSLVGVDTFYRPDKSNQVRQGTKTLRFCQHRQAFSLGLVRDQRRDWPTASMRSPGDWPRRWVAHRHGILGLALHCRRPPMGICGVVLYHYGELRHRQTIPVPIRVPRGSSSFV